MLLNVSCHLAYRKVQGNNHAVVQFRIALNWLQIKLRDEKRTRI